MKDSGISWTDHTFNPWAGCVKVSPGCDNCYAEKENERYGFAKWGKDTPRRVTSDAYWREPIKWNKQAERRERVFCGSWCDVMEESHTMTTTKESLDSVRERLYELIDRTPNLDWLLLTKRPQNFRRFLPSSWLAEPRPNVWGMTTVESQEYTWRVAELVDTPFAVRGISAEPLLGPVDLSYFLYDDEIHWVIAGGESQSGARAMRPYWARSLRDQCAQYGVAFHFKQWGEHDSELVHIGKKAAGRLLDGVLHDAIPDTGRVTI